jgi:hypothetical protein
VEIEPATCKIVFLAVRIGASETMSVPAGWMSETKLAELADVDEAPKKFHRNLVEWRQRHH